MDSIPSVAGLKKLLNAREDGENPSLPRNCERPLVNAFVTVPEQPEWEGNRNDLGAASQETGSANH